jgi:Protein of unknown function (DUF3551)
MASRDRDAAQGSKDVPCGQHGRFQEVSMRLPIVSALLIMAAIAGGSPMASAQSPTSYPWCAKTGKDAAATSCYFTSYQQCMTTISGVGGYCFQSPYYHASLASPRRR